MLGCTDFKIIVVPPGILTKFLKFEMKCKLNEMSVDSVKLRQ